MSTTDVEESESCWTDCPSDNEGDVPQIKRSSKLNRGTQKMSILILVFVLVFALAYIDITHSNMIRNMISPPITADMHTGNISSDFAAAAASGSDGVKSFLSHQLKTLIQKVRTDGVQAGEL